MVGGVGRGQIARLGCCLRNFFRDNRGRGREAKLRCLRVVWAELYFASVGGKSPTARGVVLLKVYLEFVALLNRLIHIEDQLGLSVTLGISLLEDALRLDVDRPTGLQA